MPRITPRSGDKYKDPNYKGGPRSQGGTNTEPRTGPNRKTNGHPRGWVNPDPAKPVWSEDKQAWVNKHGQVVCGAERSGKSSSGPGVCCKPAGAGTDHKGSGPCFLHWGNAPNVIQSEMKKSIKSMWPQFAEMVDTNPHEAIMWEVRRTAGMVNWLVEVIKHLGNPNDPDDPNTEHIGVDATLHQFTNLGIKPSVWYDMLTTERKHLVSVCKAAADMGVAERHVQIAEEQGKQIAYVLRNFIMHPRLALTPEQRVHVPEIMRECLMQITAIETTGHEVEAET